METNTLCSLAIAATFMSAMASNVHAQVSQQTLDTISAPGKIETRLGTLEFKDSAPGAGSKRGSFLFRSP